MNCGRVGRNFLPCGSITAGVFFESGEYPVLEDPKFNCIYTDYESAQIYTIAGRFVESSGDNNRNYRIKIAFHFGKRIALIMKANVNCLPCLA